MARKATRGRRVKTSVLRYITWHGYAEYRGTLITLVPFIHYYGNEAYREFDAYFALGEPFVGLRVLNERNPSW